MDIHSFYRPKLTAYHRGLRNPPCRRGSVAVALAATLHPFSLTPCLSALFGRDKLPWLRCQGGGSRHPTSQQLVGDRPGSMGCADSELASLGLACICNTSGGGFIFTHGPAKNIGWKELTKLGRCPQGQIEWH